MNIPPWLMVIFISIFPWVELRGGIPTAILYYKLNPSLSFLLAVIGNMIPVPFILIFFGWFESFLRKYRFWEKKLDKLFKRTRERVDEKIKKYEYIGLILFVAIPLPFTGAWTGSLISYLFGLKFSKSILTIFAGVLIAGFIVTTITIFFGSIFS